MRSLRKHRVTLKRSVGKGSYNEDGIWVDAVTFSEEEIRCCLQPFKDGSVKQFLPEGVMEKDSKVLITETKLIGSSEESNTQNDIIIIDGVDYDVFQIENWNGLSRIRAYYTILIRSDKL